MLLACAQARCSVPEPRVCGRLRLCRLSEGSQVTSCYKGSTYLLTYLLALSRCRSLQHIRVLGFDPAKVKAHPAALRFVEGLANTAPRGAEAAAG